MTRSISESFSKKKRLLKSEEFRFRPFKKLSTQYFTFVYTSNGKGRLGISLSKKVLKQAVARNRIKRLLRESYRKNGEKFNSYDIHVIGLIRLKECWKTIGLKEIREEFETFYKKTGA